ncbi:putative membrane protein YgcG [Pedobacter sp. UYEF25]
MKSIKRTIFLSVGCLAAISLMASCASVKPYQKNRLNDAEMILSARKVQKFEQSFQLYREGASGANGGKSGGGCGCN